MPTKYKRAQPQKSTYTPATAERRGYSSGRQQKLTKNEEQSPTFRHEDDTQTNIIYTQKRSPHINSVNSNDPQLLAEILKPTIEALAELNMAQVVRTPAGKLIIVLSPLFDDDLRLS